MSRIASFAASLLMLLAQISCGSVERQPHLQSPVSDSTLPGETVNELPDQAVLEGLLSTELARLGKDPQRTAMAAPGNGGKVFNLRANLVDADEDEEGESVDLSWVYRNVGDYDLNGLVNVSDLTPLAQYWQQQVVYDDPDSHAGIGHWPSGQPLADGGVEAGQAPAAGSGALNWRTAHVDGDANGVINLSDITPIAVNFNAVVDSYGIYRREQGTEEFSQVGAVDLSKAGQGRPLVMTYNDPLNVEDRGKLWEYAVRALDSANSSTGPESNTALAVFDNTDGFPLAQMQADPTDGLIPLEVSFTAVTEAAPLGSIVNHEWDLDGDGSWELETGTQTQAQFTYLSSGVFIARLRATDDAGRTAIAGQVITVGTAPVAVIKASPPGGEVPASIKLDGRSSFSEFGSIDKYEWDTDGDGEYDIDSGPVPEVTVSFDQPGEVIIGLRVTDDIGLSGVTDMLLELTDKYDEIEPNHVVEQATGLAELAINGEAMLVNGSIGANGYNGDQSDWYSFTVQAGCLLELTAETSGLDPILRVDIVDNDGVLVLGSIQNLESLGQTSRGLKGAGTFHLHVINQNTITGLNYDYSLRLEASDLILDETEDNDNAATADDLGELNGSILPGVWGSLGPDGEDGDDEDWWSFSINAADDYSFGLDFFHNEADLELALYDATGEVLFGVSESVTSRERIDVALDASEYRLRCYRSDGNTAYYQLSLFITP